MVYLSCEAIVHRGEHRIAESPVQFRVTCMEVVVLGDYAVTVMAVATVRIRTLA
nr:MAG TPA: hypothetical protein [Caudoviricetes sp.]